jgi:hypothetical protein
VLDLYTDIGGIVFATPSISEKGYLDLQITLSTLGGHSSVPPSHTVRDDLALIMFGSNVTCGGAGQVILSDFLWTALEPSPVTKKVAAKFHLRSY